MIGQADHHDDGFRSSGEAIWRSNNAAKERRVGDTLTTSSYLNQTNGGRKITMSPNMRASAISGAVRSQRRSTIRQACISRLMDWISCCLMISKQKHKICRFCPRNNNRGAAAVCQNNDYLVQDSRLNTPTSFLHGYPAVPCPVNSGRQR